MDDFNELLDGQPGSFDGPVDKSRNLGLSVNPEFTSTDLPKNDLTGDAMSFQQSPDEHQFASVQGDISEIGDMDQSSLNQPPTQRDNLDLGRVSQLRANRPDHPSSGQSFQQQTAPIDHLQHHQQQRRQQSQAQQAHDGSSSQPDETREQHTQQRLRAQTPFNLQQLGMQQRRQLRRQGRVGPAQLHHGHPVFNQFTLHKPHLHTFHQQPQLLQQVSSQHTEQQGQAQSLQGQYENSLFTPPAQSPRAETPKSPNSQISWQTAEQQSQAETSQRHHEQQQDNKLDPTPQASSSDTYLEEHVNGLNPPQRAGQHGSFRQQHDFQQASGLPVNNGRPVTGLSPQHQAFNLPSLDSAQRDQNYAQWRAGPPPHFPRYGQLPHSYDQYHVQPYPPPPVPQAVSSKFDDLSPYTDRAKKIGDIYNIPTLPDLSHILEPTGWSSEDAAVGTVRVNREHDMLRGLYAHVFNVARRSLLPIAPMYRHHAVTALNHAESTLNRFVDVLQHERNQVFYASIATAQGLRVSWDILPIPVADRNTPDTSVGPKSSADTEQFDRPRQPRNKETRVPTEKEKKKQSAKEATISEDEEPAPRVPAAKGKAPAKHQTKKPAAKRSKKASPILRNRKPAASTAPKTTTKTPAPGPAKMAAPVESAKGKKRKMVDSDEEDEDEDESDEDDVDAEGDEDEDDDMSERSGVGPGAMGSNWFEKLNGMPPLPTVQFDPALIAYSGTDMTKFADPSIFEDGQEAVDQAIKDQGGPRGPVIRVKDLEEQEGDAAPPKKKARKGREPPPEQVEISKGFAASLLDTYPGLPVTRKE